MDKANIFKLSNYPLLQTNDSPDIKPTTISSSRHPDAFSQMHATQRQHDSPSVSQNVNFRLASYQSNHALLHAQTPLRLPRPFNAEPQPHAPVKPRHVIAFANAAPRRGSDVLGSFSGKNMAGVADRTAITTASAQFMRSDSPSPRRQPLISISNLGDETLLDIDVKSSPFVDSGLKNFANSIDVSSENGASSPTPAQDSSVLLRRPFPTSPVQKREPTYEARSRSKFIAAPADHLPSDACESTLMRHMADTVDVYRVRCAEQSQEIERLRVEIADSNAMRADLTRRLELTKSSSKRALELSRRSCDELEASWKSLKTQAQEQAVAITELRSQSSSLQLGRDSIGEELKKLESLFDQTGSLQAPGITTRALVEELQQSCAKSQEVGYLLREKLDGVLGELADARHRIHELEASHLLETSSQRQSVQTLHECVDKLAQLTTAFKGQQQESLEGHTRVAQLELKLETAYKRVNELTANLSEINNQLKTARGFQQKSVTLQLKLDERNAQLAELDPVRQALSTTINEQEAQLRLLSALNAELNPKLIKSEADIKALQEKLQETRQQHDQLTAKSARQAMDLKEALEARASQEAMVQESRQELLCEIAVLRDQKKALENRMAEDAAIMDICKQLHCEIVALREQNKTLLDRITDKEENQDRIETNSHRLIEIQRQGLNITTRLEVASTNSCRLIQDEVSHARQEIRGAKDSINATQDAVLALTRELQELKSRAQEPRSSDSDAKLIALTEQVRVLTRTNEDHLGRAATIQARFKAGDLSAEEKAFVHLIMQTSKEIHEVEMVAKSNELRRKENLIKDQESRISSLEAELAIRLRAEAKAKAASGEATATSMLDISGFLASPSSLSDLSGQDHMEAGGVPDHLENQDRVSLTMLDREGSAEDPDIENETGRTSELGKRQREFSPRATGTNEDLARPARRARALNQKPAQHCTSDPEPKSVKQGPDRPDLKTRARKRR